MQAFEQKNEKPAAFSLKDIGFTPECRPNATFERILTVFGRNDQASKADTAVFNEIQGETSQKLMLDDPVDWHGLSLSGAGLYAGIERGPGNFTLYFRDDPAEVLKVWNDLGWKLPAIDETRPLDKDGYASISVNKEGEDGKFGSVTCWRD